MKKILILISAVSLTAAGLSAQVAPDYECLFEYTVRYGSGEEETLPVMLRIGPAGACFQDYTVYRADSVAAVPGIAEEVLLDYRGKVSRSALFFDTTVRQNDPKGKMTVQGVIAPDYYVYEEPMDGIRWTLSPEEATVCGYVCRKASGTYGGRTWTVWYAPEIPVGFGPWKLCGLPGLVMAAEDAEGIHRFSAVQFRKGSSGAAFPTVPGAIRTTRTKFLKAKNAFEENPMENLQLEAVSSITVLKGEGSGTIIVNDVPLRLHAHGYIPLELE